MHCSVCGVAILKLRVTHQKITIKKKRHRRKPGLNKHAQLFHTKLQFQLHGTDRKQPQHSGFPRENTDPVATKWGGEESQYKAEAAGAQGPGRRETLNV